jgi:hypothetical protein
VYCDSTLIIHIRWPVMVLPIVVLVVWSRSQSQSPVTTDSESVRPSAPFGARDRILLFYCLSLERCSLCLCRAPSLTRGRTVIVVSSLFTVMQYFQYYIVVIHNELFCSELSSGIYCRVKLLSTDVSEVRTASIIRDNSEHHTRRRENLKSH